MGTEKNASTLLKDKPPIGKQKLRGSCSVYFYYFQISQLNVSSRRISEGQREARSDIASKTPFMWEKPSELGISIPTLKKKLSSFEE